MDLDNEELKATREMKAINKIIAPEEKTADEMFEELGYRKEEHNYIACGKVIEYHNEINSPFDFMIDRKEVKIWEITIGIEELKAINKKCKELGWIE